MLVHWIWLATRPDVSDRVKIALLARFCDPEAVYFADTGSFSDIEGLTDEGRDALADKDLHPAKRILTACERAGLQILTYQDAAYPARLKNISDPPPVFYYKGRLPDFDGTPLIGVVGTRKASAYGLKTALKMGYQIASCGAVVVSGMAGGIDGEAMRGALTAGAPVVGILGCGADIVYPRSNWGLFADTERYGCILSEFPPGTPPTKWTFPKRNRIISGMSCGVLVVEAPEKSGALITAGHAAEQGRDVFVVPGNIDVPTCAGSNRLLRDGAIAVGCGWDVVSEYEALYPDRVHSGDEAPELLPEGAEKPMPKVAQTPKKPRKPGRKELPEPEKDKKVIDKRESSPYSDVNDILPGLSEPERAIVEALRGGARQLDDVIAETELPASRVLPALTMLEIKGIVKRLPGKRISL